MTDNSPLQQPSRRDVLKKSAVAGAVVWTVPVVSSFTNAAFAAGSTAGEQPGCPEGAVPMRFRFNISGGSVTLDTGPTNDNGINHCAPAGWNSASANGAHVVATALSGPDNSCLTVTFDEDCGVDENTHVIVHAGEGQTCLTDTDYTFSTSTNQLQVCADNGKGLSVVWVITCCTP